jgi:3-phenylpropionate/cinnamic acid dioxygenase small subunit
VTIEAGRDRWSDVAEITALVHRYGTLLDAGDLDGVAALFEHATWRAEATGQEARGRHGVRRMYDGVQLYDGTPRTTHLITNLDVIVDHDRSQATTSCTYTVLQAIEPGGPIEVILTGRYLDRFERAEEGWRFTERRILVNQVGDLSRHFG